MFSKVKQKLIRGTSLLTLVFFLSSQVTFANPGAGIEMAAVRETPGFLQIDIPDELATLDGLYEAPPHADPKFILHVQNAHANYGAQEKIKKLLEYLNKTYAIKTLFVEGASEDLNPDYLKMFPDKERNLKLAQFLAEQGELTGAELFLLESEPGATSHEPRFAAKDSHGPWPVERGPRAHGIERAELYRENYEALKKVFGSEATVKKYLDGFEGRLSGLASKVFPGDMIKLLGEWKKFEKGHREFMPYVRNLSSEAKRVLGIDLESLFAQVEWPQTTRLLVLQSMEKELDTAKGLAERDALIKFLKEKNVSGKLVAAIENFKDQRVSVMRSGAAGQIGPIQPRDLMEQLVIEAGPKGFRFSDYPNFSLYAGYLILKSELDPKSLFTEIRALFTRILDKWATTQQQKALLALYRDEELVRKLLNLELTRKDWREVLGREEVLSMDAMVGGLKKIGTSVSQELNLPLSNFETKPVNPKFKKAVSDVQDAAYRFYEAARKREDVFYEKIDTVMRRDSLTKAVVITGGFHTDGITELLREHEVSYGVLTPRLSERSDENLYRSVMLQNKASTFELSYLEAVSRLESFRAQGAQLGEKEVLRNLMPVLRAIGRAGDFGTVDGAIGIFNQSDYAKNAGIQIDPNAIGQKNGRPVYRVNRSAIVEVSKGPTSDPYAPIVLTEGNTLHFHSLAAQEKDRPAGEDPRFYVFEDAKGARYFVKKVKHPGAAFAEYFGYHFFKILGFPVPEMHEITKMGDGNFALVAPFVEDLRTVQDLHGGWEALTKENQALVREAFYASALFQDGDRNAGNIEVYSGKDGTQRIRFFDWETSLLFPKDWDRFTPAFDEKVDPGLLKDVSNNPLYRKELEQKQFLEKFSARLLGKQTEIAAFLDQTRKMELFRDAFGEGPRQIPVKSWESMNKAISSVIHEAVARPSSSTRSEQRKEPAAPEVSPAVSSAEAVARRSESRMTAQKLFEIQNENFEQLGREGELKSRILWNDGIKSRLSPEDKARLEHVLTHGDDWIGRLINSILAVSDRQGWIEKALGNFMVGKLRDLDAWLYQRFNKTKIGGEYHYARTLMFKLKSPITMSDGRILRVAKIKGGRIPRVGEIQPFLQAGELQTSVTFTAKDGKAKFVPATPHPYLTTDADHAANEFYADLAMAKAGYLVPEAVAYGVSEKVFKYSDASGDHQEVVGYFVSLLPDENDERFYEIAKGRILKAFDLSRRGRLSEAGKQDLREWLHRSFESYGQAFRKLNKQFIHTRPHTGNVNLESDQFNIQDNDRVIPIKVLSSEDRLAYLIEELFQMLQAVHEYEGMELVGGVKVQLYGDRQTEVIAFLRSIGVDLQAAMLRGYFAHVTDSERISKIAGASTVDAMQHATFSEDLTQLFKDEFFDELATPEVSPVEPSAETPETGMTTATPQAAKRSEMRLSMLESDIAGLENEIRQIGVKELPVMGFHGQPSRGSLSYFYFVFRGKKASGLDSDLAMLEEEFLERLQGTIISTTNYSEFDLSKGVKPVIHLLNDSDGFRLFGTNEKSSTNTIDVFDLHRNSMMRYRYFPWEGVENPKEVPDRAKREITLTDEELSEIQAEGRRVAEPQRGLSPDMVMSSLAYRLLYKKVLGEIVRRIALAPKQTGIETAPAATPTAKRSEVRGPYAVIEEGSGIPTIGMDEKSRKWDPGKAIIKALTGSNAITVSMKNIFGINVSKEDIRSVTVRPARFSSRQKIYFDVAVVYVDGMQQKRAEFLIYAPGRGQTALGEEVFFKQVSEASDQVPRYGGVYVAQVESEDASRPAQRVPLVFAEPVKGENLFDLEKRSQLTESQREYFERQAVRLMFGIYKSTSESGAPLFLDDGGLGQMLLDWDQKTGEWTMKLVDLGSFARVRDPRSIAGYFRGVFRKPILGMEESAWVWSEKQDKSGFYSGIIDVFGWDKGKELIQAIFPSVSAQEYLNNPSNYKPLPALAPLGTVLPSRSEMRESGNEGPPVSEREGIQKTPAETFLDQLPQRLRDGQPIVFPFFNDIDAYEPPDSPSRPDAMKKIGTEIWRQIRAICDAVIPKDLTDDFGTDLFDPKENVEKALNHLLGNSVDAIFERIDRAPNDEKGDLIKKAEVQLSVKRNENTGEIVMTLSDNGIGIPLSVLESLSQGKPVTSHKTSGVYRGKEGVALTEVFGYLASFSYEISITSKREGEDTRQLARGSNGEKVLSRPTEDRSEIGTDVTLTMRSEVRLKPVVLRTTPSAAMEGPRAEGRGEDSLEKFGAVGILRERPFKDKLVNALEFYATTVDHDGKRISYASKRVSINRYLQDLTDVMNSDDGSKMGFDTWLLLFERFMMNLREALLDRSADVIAGGNLLENLTRFYRRAPRSEQYVYLEKIMRMHIRMHGDAEFEKAAEHGGQYTYALLERLIGRGPELDREAIEEILSQFGIESSRGDFDLTKVPDDVTSVPFGADENGSVLADEEKIIRLKKDHESLYNSLFYKQNLSRLLSYASFLRHFFRFDTSLDRSMSPLEFAVKNGFYFHLGGNVYLAPTTQSFRRYVVFEMTGSQGNPVFGKALEIKVPGLLPRKRSLWKNGYIVSKKIAAAYPGDEKISEDSLAFLELKEPLTLYGQEMSFSAENPAGVQVFEYDFDASRQNFVDIYSLFKHWKGGSTLPGYVPGVMGQDPGQTLKEEWDEFVRAIGGRSLELMAKVRALGFYTGTDGGDGNNRLGLGSNGEIIVRLAGDFEDYKEPEDESVYDEELSDRIKGLLSTLRVDRSDILSFIAAMRTAYRNALEDARPQVSDQEKNLAGGRSEMREEDSLEKFGVGTSVGMLRARPFEKKLENAQTFDVATLEHDARLISYGSTVDSTRAFIDRYLRDLKDVANGDQSSSLGFDAWLLLFERFMMNTYLMIDGRMDMPEKVEESTEAIALAGRSLVAAITQLYRQASGSEQYDYLEKVLRMHIRIHGAEELEKSAEYGGQYTYLLLKNLTRDGSTFDRDAMEEILDRFGVKSKNAIFDLTQVPAGATPASFATGKDKDVLADQAKIRLLKQDHESLYNVLFYKENLSRLLSYASFLRHFFEYKKSLEPGMSPLEFALKNGLYFHLGGNIYVAPTTQSFRRYIVFEMTGSPENPTYGKALEIKVPGLLPRKRDLWKTGYIVSKKIAAAYQVDEKISEDVLAFLELQESLKMYGQEMPFSAEKPAGVQVFEYDFDASRQNLVDIYSLLEKRTKIFKERLAQEKASDESSTPTDSSLIDRDSPYQKWKVRYALPDYLLVAVGQDPAQRRNGELSEFKREIAGKSMELLAKVHALYDQGADGRADNNRLGLDQEGNIIVLLAGDFEGYIGVKELENGDTDLFNREVNDMIAWLISTLDVAPADEWEFNKFMFKTYLGALAEAKAKVGEQEKNLAAGRSEVRDETVREAEKIIEEWRYTSHDGTQHSYKLHEGTMEAVISALESLGELAAQSLENPWRLVKLALIYEFLRGTSKAEELSGKFQSLAERYVAKTVPEAVSVPARPEGTEIIDGLNVSAFFEFGGSILSAMQWAHSHGLTHLETSFDILPFAAGFAPDSISARRLAGEYSPEEIQVIRQFVQATGIQLTIHSPIVGPAIGSQFLFEDAADNLELMKEQVRVAGEMGAIGMVFHLTTLTRAKDYAELVLYASKVAPNLKINLENSYDKTPGKKNFPTGAQFMKAFKEVFEIVKMKDPGALKNLGIVLDVAHYNLSGEDPVISAYTIAQSLRALAEENPESRETVMGYLQELHLNQNLGPMEFYVGFSADLHSPVSTPGPIDIAGVITVLALQGFYPFATLEQAQRLSPKDRVFMRQALERAQEIRKEIEAAGGNIESVIERYRQKGVAVLNEPSVSKYRQLFSNEKDPAVREGYALAAGLVGKEAFSDHMQRRVYQKLFSIRSAEEYRALERAGLTGKARLRPVAPGKEILTQGEMPDPDLESTGSPVVYLIVKGAVSVFVSDPETLKVWNALNLITGKIFGERSALKGEAPNATVVARDNTLILELPILEIEKLMPDIRHQLLGINAQREAENTAASQVRSEVRGTGVLKKFATTVLIAGMLTLPGVFTAGRVGASERPATPSAEQVQAQFDFPQLWQAVQHQGLLKGVTAKDLRDSISFSEKQTAVVKDTIDLLMQKNILSEDAHRAKVVFLSGIAPENYKAIRSGPESFAMAFIGLNTVIVDQGAYLKIPAGERAKWLAIKIAHEIEHILLGENVPILVQEAKTYAVTLAVMKAFGDGTPEEVDAQERVAQAFEVLSKNPGGAVTTPFGLRQGDLWHLNYDQIALDPGMTRVRLYDWTKSDGKQIMFGVDGAKKVFELIQNAEPSPSEGPSIGSEARTIGTADSRPALEARREEIHRSEVRKVEAEKIAARDMEQGLLNVQGVLKSMKYSGIRKIVQDLGDRATQLSAEMQVTMILTWGLVRQGDVKAAIRILGEIAGFVDNANLVKQLQKAAPEALMEVSAEGGKAAWVQNGFTDKASAEQFVRKLFFTHLWNPATQLRLLVLGGSVTAPDIDQMIKAIALEFGKPEFVGRVSVRVTQVKTSKEKNTAAAFLSGSLVSGTGNAFESLGLDPDRVNFIQFFEEDSVNGDPRALTALVKAAQSVNKKDPSEAVKLLQAAAEAPDQKSGFVYVQGQFRITSGSLLSAYKAVADLFRAFQQISKAA